MVKAIKLGTIIGWFGRGLPRPPTDEDYANSKCVHHK